MATSVALPRPLSAQSGLRSHVRLWPEWLTLSLYIALLAFAIPFHEPWADEAQAWQLARALSVHDLLFHALRYEGSPGLWHLLLHGLIRLHTSYAAMHWIVGVIAMCGMSLLIFFSPFPRWVRLSLPFTVFFAFQWAVVARSYVLVPLLAFAVAVLWKRNTVGLAVMLGLLANSSLHGFALAAALSLVYLIETNRGLHRPDHPRFALVILIAFFALAVATVLPPPSDLTFDEEVLHQPVGERIVTAPFLALAYLARASAHPWQLGVPAAIAFLWLIYRIGGKLYLLPVLCVALLSGLSYWNYWHLGFASVALITTAWVGWRPVEQRWRRSATCFVALWLAIQLFYSAFAITWDHENHYSPDQEAAQYLRQFVRKGLPLAVSVANKSEVGAFHSVGLGPYFDKPVFINQPRLYWLWSTHEHTEAQFEAALDKNPAAIIAMFYTHNRHRLDRKRDLDSRRLRPLYQRGYDVTQIFCGEKPEDLGLREEICEIVLER